MKAIRICLFFILIFSFFETQHINGQTNEVIYGRKNGMALTMLVQKPETEPVGKAIIVVISAGWSSDYTYLFFFRNIMKPLSDHGYTLFYVMHGSQPKYTVPEAIEDVKKAVRYIRYHASEYGIDPDHIGITGGSAGGHLSLVMATTGDDGNPEATNHLEKVSSRVQAVACFYPPVDFLHYSHEGDNVILHGEIEPFQAPFDFTNWNSETFHYELITDPEKRTEIGRQISPLYFITSDDPPVYIIHGDADKTVPLSQSERFITKLKEAGIPCELKIIPGADHGWPDMRTSVEGFSEWFDLYLKNID